MLIALLVPLVATAAATMPQPPPWSVRCTELHGLPAPTVIRTPKGDSTVVVTEIVVTRFDATRRLLSGRSTETRRILNVALGPRPALDSGADSIAPGDKAMMRLIVDPPCTVRVDGSIVVNLWVSNARIIGLLPGGFSFDKLDYHTAEVDDGLSREEGFVVPKVAVPLPHATFNVTGDDRGALSELAPGMRLKSYGHKSPHSDVVRFFRVERF